MKEMVLAIRVVYSANLRRRNFYYHYKHKQEISLYGPTSVGVAHAGLICPDVAEPCCYFYPKTNLARLVFGIVLSRESRALFQDNRR